MTSDAVQLVRAGRDPLVQGLHVGVGQAEVEVCQGVGLVLDPGSTNINCKTELLLLSIFAVTSSLLVNILQTN